MDEVFILHHINKLGADKEDVKLIGVYVSRSDADGAIKRLVTQPGFRDAPDGFFVESYLVGKDHWTEGYVTVHFGNANSDCSL